MKNVDLQSFADADALAQRVATLWLDEIAVAERAGKPHCVALSGGRITQKFFASAVEQARARKLSFGKVHFFWADERCLPPTDPESNFKMANERLFAPLKISESQIHRLRGEEVPEIAAKQASAELVKIAGLGPDGLPILDLIFLGMGEDGHVASLFPGKSAGTDPKEIFSTCQNSPSRRRSGSR